MPDGVWYLTGLAKKAVIWMLLASFVLLTSSGETMNYYYYISDAKVDMLLPQIGDARIKKISKSLGVDVRLFTAKRDVEYEENDRIARLETVCSFIREFGNLGTVDAPNEYIEDSLLMHFTNLSDKSGGVAYFSGKTSKGVLGMGGSMNHVIGGGFDKSVALRGSHAMTLLEAIRIYTAGSEKKPKGLGLDGVAAVERMLNGAEYPKEQLRFMAKRLVTSNDGSVMLASPLYVSKED